MAERPVVLPPTGKGGHREKPDLVSGNSVRWCDRCVFGINARRLRSKLDQPNVLGHEPALSEPGGLRSRDSSFSVTMDICGTLFSDNPGLMAIPITSALRDQGVARNSISRTK